MATILELQVAQREVDDGLQSITFEHRIGRSLNNFFVARQYLDGATPTKADVDDYWATAFGPLTGSNIVAVYSRKAFNYPLMCAYTTITVPVAGAGSWIGLENGAQGYSGRVSLQGTATQWLFDCRTLGHSAYASLDVTSLLPASYGTSTYNYIFKLNKCNAELFISGLAANQARPLRAIILHGLNEIIPEWEAEPYALGGSVCPMPSRMNSLIELNGAVSSFGCNMSTLNSYTCQDGDPLPPRQYQAYSENTSTKWQALATGGTTKTSHPVPVWGYQTKTLLFIADAAGTLSVQGYTGGAWRTIATPTVVGNTLLQYDLTAEVPIARLVYEPLNGDTITAANWYLS